MDHAELKEFNNVIIVPCFEDLSCLKTLISRVDEQFSQDLCMVIVDDGSVKQPINDAEFEQKNISLLVCSLARNYGNQTALYAGICFTAKRCSTECNIIIMDCDGEDRPEDIAKLTEAHKNSESNVTVARRMQRHDSYKFKFFYKIYRLIFGITTGKKISFGNFMVMDTEALVRLALMSETSTHLPATLIASKLDVGFLDLDRGKRYFGESKMNLTSLTLHGFKGLMVFSDKVLIRLGLLCALLLTGCLSFGFLILMLKFYGLAAPGWASIAIGILSIMFFQIGSIILIALMLFGVSMNKGLVYSDGENLIKHVAKKTAHNTKS